jgi:hypothetical protein
MVAAGVTESGAPALFPDGGLPRFAPPRCGQLPGRTRRSTEFGAALIVTAHGGQMRVRSLGPARLAEDTGDRLDDPRVRVLQRVSAALLLVVGIVAGVAIHAPSGHADTNGSLTVSPGRGGPQAEFAVLYRWPAVKMRKRSNACFPQQVTFTWDGSPLGRGTSTLAGRTCVATLRSAPPPGAYGGTSTHTISAADDPSARATYSVTGSPDGSSRDPAPTAVPEDTTIDGAVDSINPADPLNPQATAFAAPSDRPTPAASADGERDPGSGLVPWLIAFGAVLFLTGTGTLGLSVLRSRRPGPDTDTQPLPLANQAVRRPAHRA